MNEQQPTRILLVEDEVLIAMATAQKITRFGYEVVTAQSGEEAIRIATGSEPINLILINIDLGGGIDGPQAAQQILATRHIPIVFLSAYTEEEYVNRVKEITRYGYIIKGSGDFILKSSIEMALELFQEHEKTRKSEAFLRATGRMAKVGGWELDAKTRVVSWTEETYRIHDLPLEYTPPLEEAINFFHPQDREQLTQAIQKALDHGTPYDMECRFITARGKRLWVRTLCQPVILDGTVVKLMGTFQDISERKRLQAEHQKEEKFVEQIAATSPVGITKVDSMGNIVYANKKAETVLDLRKSSIEVRTYDDPRWGIQHVDGTPYPVEELPFEVVKKTGQPVDNVEHAITFPDGTRTILSVNAAPLYDEHAHFDGMIATIEDITERKKQRTH